MAYLFHLKQLSRVHTKNHLENSFLSLTNNRRLTIYFIFFHAIHLFSHNNNIRSFHRNIFCWFRLNLKIVCSSLSIFVTKCCLRKFCIVLRGKTKTMNEKMNQQSRNVFLVAITSVLYLT